ncbi:carbamoyltransferase C-terminal domain-containing protein [Micromonospora sp. FIMYZ51]|uniref:carbamoyltransferase family protein n=1 Tax=Micromonospora sp. FIMYZ51 TaxID=3051832 RepID=UPI00311D81DD
MRTDGRYTLGLNINLHDASAALLRDGRLVRLVEQEKVSRRKHALGQPPTDAIRELLAAEGITAASLEAVAVGWDLRRTPLGRSRRLTPEALRKTLFPHDDDLTLPPLTWVPHHLAHAASAYYPSGESDAAIIVIDGAGESQCSTIAHGRDGRIEILREWPISQSLGFFYAAASKWAGLGEWGAGKLMGLAAYGRAGGEIPLHGRPDGYELLLPDAPPEAGSSSGIPRMGFPAAYDQAVRRAFGCHYPYASRAGEDAIAYADFAASVQSALEDAVLGLATYARERTGASALVLAGGVGMNCSMVGRLLRSGLYDRIYVPPVPTDVGVSLGAAIVEARDAGVFTPEPIDHAYWSLGISAAQAGAAVTEAGLVSLALDEARLAALAGDAVADGRVIAWARGNGEIGQRALGARSLVADPRDRRTLERLNVIKGREMWRPVAPSVLHEHIGELIATPTGSPASFMLAAGAVRPAMRQVIPAVTHVDGSARPQDVDRATNPGYWSMIDRFRQRTGVPAVVNTSLNLAGEPIVNTAAEAVDTFLRAKDIDLLILADRVVARAPSELPEPAEG